MSKKIFFLILILFLIINLNFIIHLDDFVFLKNSDYSDIPISHFPNIYFIQQEILHNHEIPLWSNLIYSGYPFVENPLSGIWYLWGWIAVLFPLPLGINLNLLLHLFFGVIGLFLLLRIENRSNFASLFGAFAFGFCTKMVSHVGSGHLSMIYALCWTPWLLYFTKKIQHTINWTNYLFPGLIFGFIITSDPRWVIPSGLLWFFYTLFLNVELKTKFFIFFSSILTGLLTSIGMWFSLQKYLNLSTRSLMTANDRNVFSLQIKHLLGLFFPENGTSSEWVLYPSAIILLLVILGLFLHRENKPVRFWYFVILISLILSFGNSFPGIGFIFSLPGFSILRVPSRFIWLVFFSYSFVSSFVIDDILKFKNNYKFDRLFFIVPVTVFQILLLIGIFTLTTSINYIMMISTICFIFGTILIGLIFHKENLSLSLIKGSLFCLLFFELFIINLNLLNYKESETLFFSKPELISEIKTLPKYARIYTPSYSLSQEEAAFWQINQINGVDPMQLTDYVRFFEQTSGIKYNSYSVTLPPFTLGHPEIDNKYACPNKTKLITLNVGMVISDFELKDCSEFSDYKLINNKFVYRIESDLKPVNFLYGDSEIDLLEYSPNHIRVETRQGGRLFFNEIFYPGWKVFVNGTISVIGKNEIFRFVDLPEGKNDVELRFFPDYLMYVTPVQLISLFSVLFLFFLEFVNVRKNR